jgi:hypothetical protein
MKESLCKFCNNSFKYNPLVKKGLYCSNKCSASHRHVLQTEKNKQLLLSGSLSDNNRSRIKKTMLALGIENKCAICGITDWLDKPIPFVLDHIDGNANNNILTNLRFLCSNCDSQTDTYKGKNKGSGRNNGM